MKQYIFFTNEGHTYDPNHHPLHTMQLLGSAEGKTVHEAFTTFKREQPYLLDHCFTHVMALEYVGVYFMTYHCNDKGSLDSLSSTFFLLLQNYFFTHTDRLREINASVASFTNS
jgi:hypothetical protein